MTAFAGVLQSWRERFAPARDGAPAKGTAQRARSVAEPIPVREWISVDPGQPARLSSFDRTLVCVVVALLALGLVMVYSASVAMPDNPKFARYTPTYLYSTSGGVWCNWWGYCWVVPNDHFLQQGDVTGGIVFRF